MRRLRGERGFTLVELLVTMVISLVVLGAVLSLFEVFQTNARYVEMRNENQDATRATLDRLAQQLRNVVARTTSTGTVPGALEQAEEYGITFETVNTGESSTSANKLHAMRVRYCLDDSNPEDEVLWEEVEHWTSAEAPPVPTSEACPDTNTKDWEKTTRVVQNVTNRLTERKRPLFTYSAKETPEILAVNTDMFLDLKPKQARPKESELTTGVSLRNANRQPIAAFTAIEEGNRQVRLNASASYDPDGLTLTYRWWLDGKELSTTSQQYVTKVECEQTKEAGFCVKSTPKFTLTVTNPGGLSETVEKNVEIK